MTQLWLDAETTGLDKDTDHILELGWCFTGNDYRRIAEGSGWEVSDNVYKLLIRPTQETFDKIRSVSVVFNMHSESGLLEDLEKAFRGEINSVSLAEAEKMIVADLDSSAERDPEWDERIKWIISGRSVAFDRGFIETQMPTLFSRLGHRMHDISNFTHFFKHRIGLPDQGARPIVPHRADQDIDSDLREMRYYGDLVTEAFNALRRERLSAGMTIDDLPPLYNDILNEVSS